MDVEPLEYSEHVLRRMRSSCITKDEVEAIVYYPAWRRRSRLRRIEHFGYSDDGRLFKIITDRYERRVITVVEKPLR